MRPLSLAIVGADHPNKRGPARRFALALCTPGEPLELRPEPKNPADERAIAVYICRGVQLGYLTAERAPLVGNWIRSGREIVTVFQGRAGFGGWARVAFDGEKPVLPYPPPADSVDAETEQVERDFWPDPENNE